MKEPTVAYVLFSLGVIIGSHQGFCWSVPKRERTATRKNAMLFHHQQHSLRSSRTYQHKNDLDVLSQESSLGSKNNIRRRLLQISSSMLLPSVVLSWMTVFTTSASAASVLSTQDAAITDRVYFTVKGLKEDGSGGESQRRIVIGLFGKAAPRSVAQLKQLVSLPTGLPALCRPRAERALQKEQLEANKVYNSCMESQDEQGVTLQYSTIWRIVPDIAIDVGAVTGKFVAREYPTWQEEEEGDDAKTMFHDAPGVVSVRRGNDGGFGFTIYAGSAGNTDPDFPLNQDNIVIGKVLEGMDVVQALNRVPVVKSSSVNYMSLTGGTTTKNAPTRACRYGGPMYCNENKPLIKLTVTDVGILN